MLKTGLSVNYTEIQHSQGMDIKGKLIKLSQYLANLECCFSSEYSVLCRLLVIEARVLCLHGWQPQPDSFLKHVSKDLIPIVIFDNKILNR